MLFATRRAALSAPFIVTKSDPAQHARQSIVGFAVFDAFRKDLAHDNNT